MDGTGKLFEPLLPLLRGVDVQIMELPDSGDQAYAALKEYVRAELPDEDYILVAESFSGPIARLLAEDNIGHLKSVIFVATFLTPPNTLLLNIFRLLPIKQLANLPFSSIFLRRFLLGQEVSMDQISRFQRVLRNLPSLTLKRRLSAIRSLSIPEITLSTPAVYIQPESDSLVPSSKGLEFHRYFRNLTVRPIKGPHFILQANPEDCATIIMSELHTQRAISE